jgi:hypothetical protein
VEYTQNISSKGPNIGLKIDFGSFTIATSKHTLFFLINPGSCLNRKQNHSNKDTANIVKYMPSKVISKNAQPDCV